MEQVGPYGGWQPGLWCSPRCGNNSENYDQENLPNGCSGADRIPFSPHCGKRLATSARMAAFRFAICLAALLRVWSCLPNPLFAQSLKTPEFQERAIKGFDHVYSLDYEDARIAFENLRQQYPQHPGPPLYLALTVWQRELFRR